MCAGSCSQEILESEEVMPDGQTRASTFEISLIVDPAGAGPGNEYYAQNRDYNFQAVYDEQYLDLMQGEITVRAIEGNDDAVKIVSRTDDRATPVSKLREFTLSERNCNWLNVLRGRDCIPC